MAFQAKEVLPGVHHIMDCMGVCMTLVTGRERALLVDTGYGIEDVAAYVRTFTQLPLTVIITHGHHDHALGARWFEETLMFPEDQEDFAAYTAARQRRAVLAGARGKGIQTDEAAYLTAPIPMPLPLTEQTLDLGGLTAQIMNVPGHTPGSAVVLVPELSLLLTADDWNPCTWLFFPKALPVKQYRENLRGLLELPFSQVLCSHQPVLFPRAKIDEFAAHLDDDNLRAAPAVNITPYDAVDTHQADMGEEQILVFDWQKAGL